MPPPSISSPRRIRLRLLALAVGLLVALLLGEIAARVWVSLRWSDERIEQLTTHSSVRGRFASHPNLPFVLRRSWRDVNEAGYRGEPVSAQKPAGVRRLACIGASTTYGLYVSAAEAYPAQLGVLLSRTHGEWEVLNAGVPGWVSTEMVTDLLLRVLAFSPDVVVILEGRNEVIPQAYENFLPDYSHYRRPGFSYATSNYGHKHAFAWSRLAMLACTIGGERFGWSELAEHPLYGGIMWENRPDQAGVQRNLADPARIATWRRQLESAAAACQAHGITPVFCTMAFLPSKLALDDELPGGQELQAAFGAQVARNNKVMHEVAGRLKVVVVEGASLAKQPELFLDDCHLTAAGHRLRAQLIYDELAPTITTGQW